MSRALIAVGGLGGATGVTGGVQLVRGVDGHGPWVWIAVGLGLLVVSQVWAVQRAITERNAARQMAPTTQTLVSMGEGADMSGSLSMHGNRMSAGPLDPSVARHPRKRWWPRVLTDDERGDLAERCESCSRELLEWLHRPVPQAPLGMDRHEAWELERRLEDEHRTETEQVFQAQYAVRVRDLLNECAEAGYSLDQDTERFRVTGDPHWHDMQMSAESLGVVGRRVRRAAKRL